MEHEEGCRRLCRVCKTCLTEEVRKDVVPRRFELTRGESDDDGRGGVGVCADGSDDRERIVDGERNVVEGVRNERSKLKAVEGSVDIRWGYCGSGVWGASYKVRSEGAIWGDSDKSY